MARVFKPRVLQDGVDHVFFTWFMIFLPDDPVERFDDLHGVCDGESGDTGRQGVFA